MIAVCQRYMIKLYRNNRKRDMHVSFYSHSIYMFHLTLTNGYLSIQFHLNIFDRVPVSRRGESKKVYTAFDFMEI